MQQKRLHAATLTELLAAVGIVAVLAAVLFPVLVQARDKNDDEACMSNMKQIGLGTAQYTNDYDEREPIAQHWASEIYPYIKSTAAYKCPRDFSRGTDTTYPLSYAMNENFNILRFRALSSPSATVLLTEYDPKNVNMISPTDNVGDSITNGLEVKKIATWGTLKRFGARAITPPRHDPRLMFLASDGHAVARRPDQISGGANAFTPNLRQNTKCAAGTKALGVNWALTFSAI